MRAKPVKWAVEQGVHDVLDGGPHLWLSCLVQQAFQLGEAYLFPPSLEEETKRIGSLPLAEARVDRVGWKATVLARGSGCAETGNDMARCSAMWGAQLPHQFNMRNTSPLLTEAIEIFFLVVVRVALRHQ